MARLKYHPDLSNITDLGMFIKYSTQNFNQLQDILEGSIEFDSNIASQTITVTFPTANTDKIITHQLNRTGLKFFVVDKSVSCDVYHNKTRDTITQICLKCTVATTVTIILI
jgi:hypothetical protein